MQIIRKYADCLILNEYYFTSQPSLEKIVGLYGARFLEYLHTELKLRENTDKFEDKYWFRVPSEKLAVILCFNYQTTKRMLRQLKKLGFIETRIFSKYYSKVLSYTINYQNIQNALPEGLTVWTK